MAKKNLGSLALTALLSLASSSLQNRLVFSIGGQPYDQRQVEGYALVRALWEGKPLPRPGENNWTPLMESYKKDMLLLHEAALLVEVKSPEEKLKRAAELILERFRRRCPQKSLPQELQKGPLYRSLGEFFGLQVALSRLKSNLEKSSYREMAFQGLAKKHRFRYFQGAQKYRSLSPPLLEALPKKGPQAPAKRPASGSNP